MKRVLLLVIASLALCGSIFAQYESHWPPVANIFYDNSAICAAIAINGHVYTVDDEGWDALEVAFFVGEECRGKDYLNRDNVDLYDDPYPITNFSAINYSNPGEIVIFKLYDHLNEVEYDICEVSYQGELLTIFTGIDHVEAMVDEPYDPVILNFTNIPISASANPLEGGTVTGAGYYEVDSVCTLTATPNPGYYFLNWTENDSVVSSDAEYSFVVTESRILVANFYTNHWTAEDYINEMFMIGVVQIDGIEQTSATLELGAFCNGECRGTEFPVYDEGRWLYFMTIGGNSGDDITFRLYDHELQQELNLYCFNDVPFDIYGLIGLDEPYEVHFAQQFVVSVIVNPEGSGTVTGEGTYVNGAEAILTASPNENSAFVGWTIGEEQVSTEMVYSFAVTEDITIVANFIPRYEVTVSVNPEGGGSVSGAGYYDYGTNCTLVATANAGFVFSNWSIDDQVVSTESSYTFTVTSPVSLTANFWCPVSAVVNPEDAGTVSGEGEYLIGTQVTLTAVANEGYLFNSWTLDGEIVSTEPSYTFIVTGQMSFTANFDILYQVSATISPENAGTVSGEGEYLFGAEATLIATANQGYAFNSWTLNGEVVSTEPTYTFTVTGAVNHTANFDVAQTYQLTVGWNWWSTHLDITLDDLKAALVEALPNTVITIKSQGQNTKYNNGRWIGQLTSLDATRMYRISVSTTCAITVKGVPVNYAEHPVTIIGNGITWLGFPLGENMFISDALSGFPVVNGDIIKSQTNNAIYNRGAWRGALTTFEAGKGYKFLSNGIEDRTFTFPTSTR